MNYMTKIADYEAAVERRLEKSCERNGWIASAHVSFDADYVDCQLEKFGRAEVRDDADALNSLEAFLSQEFGFRLADKPTALRRDSEKIPNTIAPFTWTSMRHGMKLLHHSHSTNEVRPSGSLYSAE